MKKQSMLLASLLVVLYGCQPESPAKQNIAAPAAAQPSAPTPPAQQATPQPVAAEAGTATASSEAVMQFAKDTGCFACHAIDKKLLGPAWKDVAARFNGNPEAEIYLMGKFANGGSGAWGNIAMPGYPDMSEANRRMLARFVLSLKPAP